MTCLTIALDILVGVPTVLLALAVLRLAYVAKGKLT